MNTDVLYVVYFKGTEKALFINGNGIHHLQTYRIVDMESALYNIRQWCTMINETDRTELYINESYMEE